MQDFLVSHLRCASCGYDLNGLNINANCPECGQPIRDSFVQDGLRLSDDRWLRVLQAGFVILGALCLWLVISSAIYRILPRLSPAAYESFRSSLVVRAGISSIISLISSWLITVHEPARQRKVDAVSRRPLAFGIRITAVFGALFEIVITTSSSRWHSKDYSSFQMLSDLNSICSCLCFWAYTYYLVIRFPSQRLARIILNFMTWQFFVIAILHFLPMLLRANRIFPEFSRKLVWGSGYISMIDNAIVCGISWYIAKLLGHMIRWKKESPRDVTRA